MTRWEPSGPPFDGWDCPCGADQPDPERLYCEPCLDRMATELVDDQEGSA